MIFCFKREMFFRLAAFCVIVGLAGCTGSKPPPRQVETPPPAQVSTPAPPPIVESVPVSHPRPPADASDNMAVNILVWDAVTKNYQAGVGETNAPFTFSLTNVSPEKVLIYDTSTTCDCTVAQLPARPWMLAPGAGGQIRATLDLRNRTGGVTNYVIVFTSKGNRLLTVTASLPKP